MTVFLRNIFSTALFKSAVLLLVTLSAQAQTADKTEKLVQQWLDIERQTAALNELWQQEKPLLEQRVALLKAESKQLQQVLDKSQGQQSAVDKQRADLLKEQNQLELQQQQVTEFVTQLNKVLAEFEGQVPPVVLASWQQEDNAITDEQDTSELLQVALAKLNKLSEFANRISVNEGQLTTADGQSVLVKQLYLGISQAWFVSHDHSIAGTGKASADGWKWHFDNDIDADAIASAIAIYEKQQQAELIGLPMTLAAQGAN